MKIRFKSERVLHIMDPADSDSTLLEIILTYQEEGNIVEVAVQTPGEEGGDTFQLSVDGGKNWSPKEGILIAFE